MKYLPKTIITVPNIGTLHTLSLVSPHTFLGLDLANLVDVEPLQ